MHCPFHRNIIVSRISTNRIAKVMSWTLAQQTVTDIQRWKCKLFVHALTPTPPKQSTFSTTVSQLSTCVSLLPRSSSWASVSIMSSVALVIDPGVAYKVVHKTAQNVSMKYLSSSLNTILWIIILPLLSCSQISVFRC